MRSMTWFETIAGNQRTCSRAPAMSSEMWLGGGAMPPRDVVRDVARRRDDALELRRVASSLLRRPACGVHDPLDDHGVGELDDHAAVHTPRDRERLPHV